MTVQRLGVLFGGHQSSSSLILAVLINNKTTTPSGFDEVYELVEFVNISLELYEKRSERELSFIIISFFKTMIKFS